MRAADPTTPRANPLNSKIWDLNASDGQNWVLMADAWDQQMYTDAQQVLLSPQGTAPLTGICWMVCTCP